MEILGGTQPFCIKNDIRKNNIGVYIEGGFPSIVRNYILHNLQCGIFVTSIQEILFD